MHESKMLLSMLRLCGKNDRARLEVLLLTGFAQRPVTGARLHAFVTGQLLKMQREMAPWLKLSFILIVGGVSAFLVLTLRVLNSWATRQTDSGGILGLSFDPFWIFIAALGTLVFTGYRENARHTQRAIDDAIRRKDIANGMIVTHARTLLPYVVGEQLEANYVAISPTHDPVDKVRIAMFIFAELDNLEFAYIKSRSGLLSVDYAIRAIKIFVARAQNRRFADTASRLVFAGKYDEPFVRCVGLLLATASVLTDELSVGE